MREPFVREYPGNPPLKTQGVSQPRAGMPAPPFPGNRERQPGSSVASLRRCSHLLLGLLLTALVAGCQQSPDHTNASESPEKSLAGTPAIPSAADSSSTQTTTSPRPRTGALRTIDLGGGVSMNLVYIRGGTFTMGSPENEEGRHPNEGPRTRVTLTGDFWMGESPVTVGQFKRFVLETDHRTTGEQENGAWWLEKKDVTWQYQSGISWRSPGFSQTDAHPVVCVSWDDAKTFCEWASRKSGLTVSLPTEAQWEFSCRAGTTTRYHWGDDPVMGRSGLRALDESDRKILEGAKKREPMLPFGDKYLYTSPGGSFRKNAWGLYDMLGHVWEWCSDWHDEQLPGGAVTNPSGPRAGSRRVFRGGSLDKTPWGPHSANRGGFSPEIRGNLLGFRVVIADP